MKNSIKKIWLLWLSLICGIWIASFVNVTRGATKIETTPSGVVQHRAVLHSLYLWNGSSDMTWAGFRVVSGETNIDVLNWMIIGTGNSAGWIWVIIWWWKGNKINGDYAGIWWWYWNLANWDYSVIWWWMYNTWDSLAVVVWGNKNKATDGGVVLWWNGGTTQWGVLLWWSTNSSKDGSMVLWFGSKWGKWSFVWNTNTAGVTVWDNSARINANNWVLIWTNTNADNKVKLVVSGAVKIWNSSLNEKWEIKLTDCITANNNGNTFALGWPSEANGSCWRVAWCTFWWVYIEEGKTAKAYESFYVINDWKNNARCKEISWWLKCEGWVMQGQWYPACFVVYTNNPVYKW